MKLSSPGGQPKRLPPQPLGHSFTNVVTKEACEAQQPVMPSKRLHWPDPPFGPPSHPHVRFHLPTDLCRHSCPTCSPSVSPGKPWPFSQDQRSTMAILALASFLA